MEEIFRELNENLQNVCRAWLGLAEHESCAEYAAKSALSTGMLRLSWEALEGFVEVLQGSGMICNYC